MEHSRAVKGVGAGGRISFPDGFDHGATCRHATRGSM